MNQFNCVNCLKSDLKPVHQVKDFIYKLSGDFELFKCENCGVFYTIPVLNEVEVSRYYPEEYRPFSLGINSKKNIIKRLDNQIALNKKRNQVTRYIKEPGAILDIGCATGLFLNDMKKHGWECWGLEPNEMAADFAIKQFNLQVVKRYLDNYYFPDNYFDVVTLWDVLEHTQNPSLILCEVRRILKPGGLLLMSLPNSDSLECSLFGRYWSGWDAPRHYLTFNKLNIKEFLSKMMFCDIKIKSFYGHHGVFMISVKNMLDEIKINNKVRKAIYLILNTVVIRILSLPFFLLLDLLNKSSIMGVVAVKPHE